MIQVIQGSIFDSKCDLLIVPCNSVGGITPSVNDDLLMHGLWIELGAIPYGKVHFREFTHTFASVIGYAASVDFKTDTSDVEAIKSCAEDIIRFAVANRMNRINLPLLGAGAGGLTPVASFEALREVFGRNEAITFNLFCLTRSIHREIIAAGGSSQAGQPPQSPRVFISYAGADQKNSLWVRKLAEALRANGVNARLDAFHLLPGADLPQWMTNEVVQANKVILICDRIYMEKADFRKGGVGWETMIIQGDMLAQGDTKQKYIAIIREEKAEEALPIYIRSKFAMRWGPNPEIDCGKLQELILALFECDLEPPLGDIPKYVSDRLRQVKLPRGR